MIKTHSLVVIAIIYSYLALFCLIKVFNWFFEAWTIVNLIELNQFNDFAIKFKDDVGAIRIRKPAAPAVVVSKSES